MATTAFTSASEVGDRLTVERHRARIVVAHLQRELELDPVLTTWCGSFRRHEERCSDLDLVAPMPKAEDDLARRLMAMFPAQVEPTETFTGPVRGLALRGLKNGFRACTVLLRLHKEPTGWLALDVHRYQWSDLMSNRGWIELIRTGPQEFSRDIMIRWRSLLGMGKKDKTPASRGGWPVFGERVFNVPTEADAFQLLQLQPIAPHLRANARFDLNPAPCREYTEPLLV